MKTYTLLGHPVTGSLSPVIHNSAFAYYGLDATYTLNDISPQELPDKIEQIRNQKIAGANVTIPYKCEVMQYLDEICPIARQCGAVNTIYLKDNKLIGSSTDGQGAILALKEEGIDCSNLKIAIMGTGGAAKSVLAAIAQKKQNFIIIGRSEAKLNSMVDIFGGEGFLFKDNHLKQVLSNVDLIINATSVGMYPYDMQSPLPQDYIQNHHIVFDLVYKPLKTKLMQEAEERGAKTVNGLGMLLFQAIEAFSLWTGKRPPLSVVKFAKRNSV